ncbi:type II toxin-antitoxin system RelE/ParE family toxin [Enterococcus sp. DIV0756]|uniref:type II toxin-antitoxin system RelE/ParE family toxin n=1 Tax=Enterococcus sp. DIV0756 TaxID=2774636 RepID=UPI003F25DA5E
MTINVIEYTPIFKKGFKRAKKKHYDMSKLQIVIELIVAEERETLVKKYNDHSLKGSHKGLRELHIERDWLLVYKIVNQKLKLYLLATGSHDEVFRESKSQIKNVE